MTTPIEARFASLMILLCDALRLPLGQRQPEHVLAAIEKLRERADNNPCKSCGADPSRYPDSGEEMPIVKGALDEQQRTEEKYFAERLRANALRDNLTAARRVLAETQSAFDPRSVAESLWGPDEANLLFPEVTRGDVDASPPWQAKYGYQDSDGTWWEHGKGPKKP